MVRLGDVVVILDLYRQGLSVTAIAERVGVDRKTVRKYIERGLEAPVYQPAAAPDQGRRHSRRICGDRITAFPELTASRLLREIREQGYVGGYTRVKDLCVRSGPLPRPATRCASRRRRAGKPRSTSPSSAGVQR